MAHLSIAQVRVEMEECGGVYLIPGKINGLSMKFVFDTGASNVSLSLTEAIFMLKNGYMNEFRGESLIRIGRKRDGKSDLAKSNAL